MKFLLVIFSLGIFSTSHGAWPENPVKTFIEELTRIHGPSTPAVATFWGAFQRYTTWTHNDGAMVEMPSKNFKSGSLPIYLSQKPSSAPLFIFMPGIFGVPDKGLSPAMIDILEEKGHVLVVPNLLGPSYIKAGPFYEKGPIEIDIKIMDEALEFALNRLGNKVNKIHLIAESLGTVVGSAWAAENQNKQHKISDMALLWPPLKLADSIKNIDKEVDTYRPFEETCGYFSPLWTILTKFTFSLYPSQLSQEEERCLGALTLVTGYGHAIHRSWKVYREAQNQDSDGEGPHGFADFVAQYRPELKALVDTSDPRLALSHWVKQIRRNPQFPIQIFTSQDDFLNNREDWEKFRKDFALSEQELIILPWGAHSGPMGDKRFQALLRQSY